MLTEGDLLRRAEIGTEGKAPGWFELFFLPGTSAYDYVQTHARKVKMLMSADIVSVSPDATLADAARLMRSHGFRRLPVVSGGRLVGILARADLLKVLAEALAPKTPFSDPEIKARLSAELAKQAWFPKAQVIFNVRSGTVEYCGTISDTRQRAALLAVAESAGATSISDKLVCIEPISGAFLD
jgi:CBS-domain-containing membrane protein